MLEPRNTSRESGGETRERLLDMAEQLFAAHGISTTSLRAITLAAGVNVAAIHYHFGSKEALVEAVFARRLAPVNRERLASLDALGVLRPDPGARHAGRSNGADGTLERILEAFLGPVIRLLDNADGARLAVLFGRLYSEPEEIVARLVVDQFGEVIERFDAALRRALPDLPATEIAWRLHCSVGALGNILASAHQPSLLRQLGLPEVHDGHTLGRLIAFCAAGFRAPSRNGVG